jgi:hypothetical protein
VAEDLFLLSFSFIFIIIIIISFFSDYSMEMVCVIVWGGGRGEDSLHAIYVRLHN